MPRMTVFGQPQRFKRGVLPLSFYGRGIGLINRQIIISSKERTRLASERGTYAAVWPRAKKTVETTHFARRLDTLQGKTIGFLWDWVFRGDEIFPMIEKELTARFPGIRFVGYEVFGATHGSAESKTIAALPDKLKQNKCDAVISGIGC